MIGWVVHTFSVGEKCFDWILNQVVHVNANDFFDDPVINQSLTRPELSVTVDYETPAARAEAEEDEDNYEAEVQDQFLSLDSYNIHLPKFHSQVNTNWRLDKYLILELRARSNFKTINEKKDKSSFLAFFLN